MIYLTRTVVVESPWRSTEQYSIEQHRCYLEHALIDCKKRSETPYASHHFLMEDDDDDLERAIGIRRGWAIGDKLDACVVFTDFGITQGMSLSIKHYEELGKPVERRTLDARLFKSILDM